MASCARNMFCRDKECSHDLQDTQKMLALIRTRSDMSNPVILDAVRAAMRLLTWYKERLHYSSPASNSASLLLNRFRYATMLHDAKGPFAQTAPLKEDTAELLTWALAGSLRQVSEMTNSLRSLVRTAELLTEDELAVCKSAPTACCAVHDQIAGLCSDLYRICIGLHSRMPSDVVETSVNSSSWLIHYSVDSEIMETRVWTNRVLSEAGLSNLSRPQPCHISDALRRAEAAYGPPRHLSRKQVESVITKHLGPSDWE